MSSIESADCVSFRVAVLDLVARRPLASASVVGPEEAEFLEALRRLVARPPAEDLWDKYHGPIPDAPARIFARYVD